MLLGCRPILVLPPADIQVTYCELTEVERDFYDALYKRSKVLPSSLCPWNSRLFLHLYFLSHSPISPISGEVWSVCWARASSPQLCFYIGVAFATSSMLWPPVSCNEVCTFIRAPIYPLSLMLCGLFLSKWTYTPENILRDFPTGA